MKYLKTFEHVKNETENLKEIANDVFVDLIDDNFIIDVIITDSEKYFSIKVGKKYDHTFIWKMVYNDINRFIDIYDNELNLQSMEVKFDGGSSLDRIIKIKDVEAADFWREIKEIRIYFD